MLIKINKIDLKSNKFKNELTKTNHINLKLT